MNEVIRVIIVTVMLASFFARAQKTIFTDEEINTAIAKGLRERGKVQGLVLVDVAERMSSALGSAMAGAKSQYGPATGVTGYTVHLYSPLTWISQQASDAAKEYRTFTRADVSPDMLEPLLRVVVYPNTPINFASASMRRSTSAQHVVLRDLSRNVVVQPSSKDLFTEELSNLMGVKRGYVGVVAVFPLDQVQLVRQHSEEFLVTVIGTGSGRHGDRDFKVKQKHFDALFGERIKRDEAGPLTPATPPNITATATKSAAPPEANKKTVSSSGTEKSTGGRPAQGAGSFGPAHQEAPHRNESGDELPRVNTDVARASEPEARDAENANAANVSPGETRPLERGCLGASYEGNANVPHDGVPISSVVLKGAADEAGLQPGDYVTAFDDFMSRPRVSSSTRYVRYDPAHITCCDIAVCTRFMTFLSFYNPAHPNEIGF